MVEAQVAPRADNTARMHGMTRENKLALIIGFGFLLFVGILVSDHLSARAGPASVPVALRSPVPNSLPREVEQPREFGRLDRPLPQTMPEFDNTRIVREQPPLQLEVPQPMAEAPEQPFEFATPKPRVHIIAKGETLGVVSKKYYNTTRYAAQLESLNGVRSSALKIGQEIQIPPIEVIDPSKAIAVAPILDPSAGYAFPVEPQQMQAFGVEPQSAPYRTVTLGKGQTLYQIAKRELGSSARWGEITQADGDRISNPNALRAGASLRVPNN